MGKVKNAALTDEKKEFYFGRDDKLQRGTYAKNLVNIINKSNDLKRNNDNESYVIGIDAPWGTGKTQFVSMLKNYLMGNWDAPKTNDTAGKKRSKVNTVYYDAWKNDFWDNAFVPFFDCIMESEYIGKFTDKDIIENIVTTGIKLTKSIGKDIVIKTLGENTEKAVEEVLKTGKDILDVRDAAEKLFPDYIEFREAIEALRKALTDMVKDQKLVVIIDELDRCKPTFAVQTLEIVKHLFNVKGIVFIFALDVSQLSHAVKVVYGDGFEAVGYLERFFNYMTMLPPIHNNSVINMALVNFGITPNDENGEIKNAFRIISRQFNLSLRDLQTVCAAYSLIWEKTLKVYRNIPNALILYFYFLTMKYKRPVEFYRAVNDPEDGLVEFLNKKMVPFIIKKGETDELYRYFTSVFSTKEISQVSFEMISFYNTERSAVSGIIDGVKNNILKVSGKSDDFSIDKQPFVDSDPNASLVLYKPDLRNYDIIKNMTVIEYIYSQLEMCNFLDEDEIMVDDKIVEV